MEIDSEGWHEKLALAEEGGSFRTFLGLGVSGAAVSCAEGCRAAPAIRRSYTHFPPIHDTSEIAHAKQLHACNPDIIQSGSQLLLLAGMEYMESRLSQE